MKFRTSRAPRALALLAVAASLVAAGCGGGDNKSTGSANANSKPTDLAFAEQMIPHHQSAIAMARIAQQRGQSAFVKNLASEIVSAQKSEIVTLSAQRKKLQKEGVKPADLGLSMKDAGMDMSSGSLKSANPFDRAFLDMMIPHHEGAVRMAQVELKQGSSPTLKKLATAIVSAQRREISEMKMEREKRFGSGSDMDMSAHSN